MSEQIDFSQELEQITAGLERRRKDLAELAPNTPHPDCDCGRSLNEHLQDEIESLTNAQAFMEGDFEPLLREMRRMKLAHIFAVVQIWRYSDLPEAQRNRAIGGTLLKMERALQQGTMIRVIVVPADKGQLH